MILESSPRGFWWSLLCKSEGPLQSTQRKTAGCTFIVTIAVTTLFELAPAEMEMRCIFYSPIPLILAILSGCHNLQECWEKQVERCVVICQWVPAAGQQLIKCLSACTHCLSPPAVVAYTRACRTRGRPYSKNARNALWLGNSKGMDVKKLTFWKGLFCAGWKQLTTTKKSTSSWHPR